MPCRNVSRPKYKLIQTLRAEISASQYYGGMDNTAMAAPQILVVDDHADIRKLLGEYLEQHGYRVLLAANGAEMQVALNSHTPDLVVLDVMMPGDDGITLLKRLRETSQLPVIMLTAMSEDADTVLGLEMGADDYVSKPFTPRVLLARIKAVLRRDHGDGEDGENKVDATLIRFDGWRLDTRQRHLLTEDNVVVALSTSEFNVLMVFVQHPQEVLSRDQLLNLTKGRDAMPFDRSIDNLISRLRKKIEDNPASPKLIKTVWGGGYLFTETASPA